MPRKAAWAAPLPATAKRDEPEDGADEPGKRARLPEFTPRPLTDAEFDELAAELLRLWLESGGEQPALDASVVGQPLWLQMALRVLRRNGLDTATRLCRANRLLNGAICNSAVFWREAIELYFGFSVVPERNHSDWPLVRKRISDLLTAVANAHPSGASFDDDDDDSEDVPLPVFRGRLMRRLFRVMTASLRNPFDSAATSRIAPLFDVERLRAREQVHMTPSGLWIKRKFSTTALGDTVTTFQFVPYIEWAIAEIDDNDVFLDRRALVSIVLDLPSRDTWPETASHFKEHPLSDRTVEVDTTRGGLAGDSVPETREVEFRRFLLDMARATRAGSVYTTAELLRTGWQALSELALPLSGTIGERLEDYFIDGADVYGVLRATSLPDAPGSYDYFGDRTADDLQFPGAKNYVVRLVPSNDPLLPRLQVLAAIGDDTYAVFSCVTRPVAGETDSSFGIEYIRVRRGFNITPGAYLSGHILDQDTLERSADLGHWFDLLSQGGSDGPSITVLDPIDGKADLCMVVGGPVGSAAATTPFGKGLRGIAFARTSTVISAMPGSPVVTIGAVVDGDLKTPRRIRVTAHVMPTGFDRMRRNVLLTRGPLGNDGWRTPGRIAIAPLSNDSVDPAFLTTVFQ